MATVAFIGIGNMGAPMVRNLLKAQLSVRVFDLSAGDLINRRSFETEAYFAQSCVT